MTQIDPDGALAFLKKQQAVGLHVDERLLCEIGRPGQLFRTTFPTQDSFLRLVWQSADATRPLTPVGCSRRLRDCAERLSRYSWSFSDLCARGYPWFSTCLEIDDEGFDYEKFGWVALVPLNDQERRETHAGSYYIFDGVHRSIVLAKKLLRREVPYREVEALLLTPRR